jgi:hypothetical protein
MVNQNFEKFRKIQSEHKSEYLSGTQERDRNDSQYNNRENTDKSPGVTGRK